MHKAHFEINFQWNHSYSLRRRRCLAIAHREARAAFPMHLNISAMHGGDESQSFTALQQDEHTSVKITIK